jgi:site-specific recombinase XerD
MLRNNQVPRKDTFVFQACKEIPGFQELYDRITRRMSIAGHSESTHKNYSRHLAQMAICCKTLPTLLNNSQIEEYLYYLQRQERSPSESFFKHTVFGLRFAFKMEGLQDKYVALPRIKSSKKLPVVLSQEEVRLLLRTPVLLKHRILIALLYDCGLRCMEVRSLQLQDIDFDRRMIHIRQGKGKKDRYVPFGTVMASGLRKYLELHQPVKWLFNGKGDRVIEGRKGGDFDSRYSQRGVQWAINQAVRKTGINKPVSVHTLRHTYATHLLEAGINIMTIQKLLGHKRIDQTLVYLHVAEPQERPPASMLDQLYKPWE